MLAVANWANCSYRFLPRLPLKGYQSVMMSSVGGFVDNGVRKHCMWEVAGDCEILMAFYLKTKHYYFYLYSSALTSHKSVDKNNSIPMLQVGLEDRSRPYSSKAS